MSMKKIIKTIYKLELTEETYKKVVELMKSTGDMEKELKEFGVINSVNIDDFIKNYIKERNTPTPYTPFDEKKKTFSYERNPKLEQDIILRSMFSTSAVPQELINNGFPLAMIPYESVDEEPEIKYSNPFKLNNFKLVSGKSKKGDKFGAISIYQYDEEGEVTANINLNHYNAIQLVKVLENIKRLIELAFNGCIERA